MSVSSPPPVTSPPGPVSAMVTSHPPSASVPGTSGSPSVRGRSRSGSGRARTRSQSGSPDSRARTRSRTGSPRSRSRSRPRRSSRSRSRPRRSSRSRSPRRRTRTRSPSPDMDGLRLHVADLDSNATKRDIEETFGKYGPVMEIWMARSVPCFAFVVFKRKEDAYEACRGADGLDICGRRVRVTMARPRTRGQTGRRGFDPSMRCYQCGERGHFSRDCPDTKYGYKRPPSPRGYRRSPSPRYRRSPSPRYRRSPSPRHRGYDRGYRRSPSPRRYRSRSRDRRY